LDGDGGGADFNAGLHRGGAELEIQFAVFVHLQADRAGDCTLETLESDLDVVHCHTEQRHGIFTLSGCGGGTGDAGGRRRDSDLRAGDRRA